MNKKIKKVQEKEQATVEEGKVNVPVQQFSVRDYFTKEVNEKIASTSDDQMFLLLRELEKSHYWWAILKYNQIRLQYSQGAILSGDPFKDPTTLVRNQGIMLGLSDLQNAVITLKAEQDAREKQAAEEAMQEVKA